MKRSIPRRALLAALASPLPILAQPQQRPNILLLLGDNWAWPHAGACGDPVVKTPVFDRLAAEGILFTHAFAPNPSCSPSRSSLLTGQETHRLGAAASLYGTLQASIPAYTTLLEQAGYFVGFSIKGWGPARPPTAATPRTPCGNQFPDFEAFLAARPKGKPFCFWYGTHDPHVPWDRNPAARDRIAPPPSPSRPISPTPPKPATTSAATTPKWSNSTSKPAPFSTASAATPNSTTPSP
ncbi:MAG: sulfatase-like hydrolase/transferase [Bryobacterales bacterium]|nr:sulfatase-like hydrolase/transferase [Bryobacterales bacterium]